MRDTAFATMREGVCSPSDEAKRVAADRAKKQAEESKAKPQVSGDPSGVNLSGAGGFAAGVVTAQSP